MWCVLTILFVCQGCKYCNNTYLSYILYSVDEIKVLSRVGLSKPEHIFFLLRVHLSCYIGKYKHWFYLANKIRATSYSTYVIPIIISVSCQWVCLYRKFLFRNITSLQRIMSVCQSADILYYPQAKEQYN